MSVARKDRPVAGSGISLIPPSKAYSTLVATLPDEKQPDNTVAVELIAYAYLFPSRAREACAGHEDLLPDSDELLKQEALTAIERMMNHSDPCVSRYAKIIHAKIIEELIADPDNLRELLPAWLN